MLNFNNKKFGKTLTNQPQQPPHNNSPHHKWQTSDFHKKQDKAKECLLSLSQGDQAYKTVNKSSLDFNPDDIQVTPWLNTTIKTQGYLLVGKSKTSIILPLNNHVKDKCYGLNPSNNNNKQNQPTLELQQQKKIKKNSQVIKKKLKSIKSSFSVLSKYRDGLTDKQNIPTSRLSQTKDQQSQQKPQHTCYIYQNNKINFLTSKHQKFITQPSPQNQSIQMITCGIPKYDQNSTSYLNNLKNNKFCIHSLTGPILKNNHNIINGTINNSNTKSSIINPLQFFKQKQLKQFHPTQYMSHCLNFPTKQQIMLNQTGSSYHNIKKKIIENIRKQSLIELTMDFQSKNSKKLIGRYFKHNKLKQTKTQFPYKQFYNSKTQISNYYTDYHNPLTKNLYQKYKILINNTK